MDGYVSVYIARGVTVLSASSTCCRFRLINGRNNICGDEATRFFRIPLRALTLDNKDYKRQFTYSFCDFCLDSLKRESYKDILECMTEVTREEGVLLDLVDEIMNN